MEELYIDLAFYEAKISLAKIEIQKYEIEMKKLKKKLSNNDLETNIEKSSTSNNLLESKNTETSSELNFEDSEDENEEDNSNNMIVPPNEIKDSDMEDSNFKCKFLLDDKDINEILEVFPEEEDIDPDNPPEWTREKFWSELDEGNMTISKLEGLLGNTIEYRYGDFINFDEHRYASMYIVGKDGVLHRNPDNSCSGGISIPLVITQYLDNALKKYGTDIANDIELGHKDITLKKYNINSKEHFTNKYYWTMDDEVYCQDKNGEEKKLELLESNSHSNIRELSDKMVVFTGGKDKNILKLFNEFNVKIGTGVSKNTTLVICKSKDEESSKMTKAKEIKTPIYTLEEFKSKYNIV